MKKVLSSCNRIVTKKHRKQDAYTPGGVMGKRPDRATIVYCNLIRQLCKIKVIANRDNIIEKNEKEIPKEEKIEIVKEELTIDEVLNSDEDISIFDEDDEVIVAGEIIYNKK